MKNITIDQNNNQAVNGEKLISYQFAGGVSSALLVCGAFVSFAAYVSFLTALIKVVVSPAFAFDGGIVWLVLSVILFVLCLAGTIIAAIARIKICNRYSNRGFELYTDKIVFTSDLDKMQIHQRSVALSVILSCLVPFYSIYWLWLQINNTKTVSNDYSNLYGELSLLLFVPFYSFYWFFTRGEMVKREVAKRGQIPASNGVAFLILSIFGLGFIALAIMQRDFNLLSSDVMSKESEENSYDLADVKKMYIKNRSLCVETNTETKYMPLTSRDFRNHLSALLKYNAA